MNRIDLNLNVIRRKIIVYKDIKYIVIDSLVKEYKHMSSCILEYEKSDGTHTQIPINDEPYIQSHRHSHHTLHLYFQFSIRHMTFFYCRHDCI